MVVFNHIAGHRAHFRNRDRVHCENEKAITNLVLKKGGSVTQADIRYETGIPKSSLSGIINALKRRNIIKKREYGRTNVIELSEWFLSEKEIR